MYKLVHTLSFIIFFFIVNPSWGQEKTDTLTGYLQKYPDSVSVLESYSFKLINQGKFIEAINVSNTIIDFGTARNIDTIRAIGMQPKIVVYGELGEYDKSFDLGVESAKIFKQNNLIYRSGTAYNKLGNNFLKCERYQEALKYFTQALEIFEEIDSNHGILAVKSNIALCKFKLNENEKAFILMKYCLNGWKAKKDLIRTAYIYINLSEIYVNMADFEEAKNCLDSAFVRAIIFNDSIAMGQILFNQSIILQKIDEPKKALNTLKQGFVFVDGKNLRIESYGYNELANTYETLKISDSAFFYLKKAKVYEDSIFKQENDQKLSNLKIIYEVEQKEQQINLLSVENKVKEKEIEAKASKIFYLSSFSVLLLLAIIIFFILKKALNKSNIGLIKKNIALIKNEEALEKVHLENKVEEIETKNFSKEDNLDTEQKSTIFLRVEHHMKKDKLFLIPNLTLEYLSKKLEINRTYLSQVINEKFGSNFSRYINEYRVKEAIKQLLNEDFTNLSIEGIGKNCGFKSNSVFYKAFKDFTGVTPSFFMKQAKNIT